MSLLQKQIWTTTDEMEFLDYMANAVPRGEQKIVLSIEERKQRLMKWMEISRRRTWGQPINLQRCRMHANYLLSGLV